MIKRVTAIFTAIAMCGITSVAGTRIHADVNGDGKINTADVVEVYNVILNIREATSITIGDFPTTGWSDDETIGTPDEGKTAWIEGDVVTLLLNSPALGEKTYTLTYSGESWTADTEIAFTYLVNEDYTATAVYSPSGEAGTVEYLEGECTIDEGKITIDFTNTTRDYSRLRIAGLENQQLTVDTKGFTPAGTTSVATEPYTLTTDEKGNAYLYGTFAEEATVTVKQGTATLAGFTFSEDKDFANGTEHNKSYALDARSVIDLSQYTDGTTVDITENCRIIGDGNEYNLTLNVTDDAIVVFEVGTSGVKLNGEITVADGKTLTLLVKGNAEHTVKGGISLGNSSNVIIEGELSKENNKLTVNATDGNAGIGANGGVTAGDITIRNARVEATGSSREVSVDSNKVFGADTSISGAAIGTSDGSMGNILIENSIIVAEGGYYESTSHAAAIGIGFVGSTMGNITLIDSQITARNNGDGLASVIGAGANHHTLDVTGTLGDIIITNTDLNLSMEIGVKEYYAAFIGSGIGKTYGYVNMGKIIFTDMKQEELDEIIPAWLPSDFNQYGAYVLGIGYEGIVYKCGTFGGVWVSDGNGGTIQIGDESGYYDPE